MSDGYKGDRRELLITAVRTFIGLCVVAWIAVFLSMGLWPYNFDFPPSWRLHATWVTRDVVANFLSFVPLGLLLASLTRRRPLLVALLWSLSLSIAVEFGQQFLPRRFPSVTDLFANVMGGLVGALAVVIAHRAFLTIRSTD